MRWIDCSDRLPEGDDLVLVWMNNNADNLLRHSTSNPEFVRLHWRNWCSHWMPLPPGPRVNEHRQDTESKKE